MSQPDDERETRRIYLLTRSGQATGEKRQAWVITLKSGNEIVLVLPERSANELRSMGGYVGRIRPAADTDEVTVGEPSTKRLEQTNPGFRGSGVNDAEERRVGGSERPRSPRFGDGIRD